MSIALMQDLDISGKKVLIREDLNAPIKEGVVSSDARLRAALPTIKLALEKGAALIVMSHLGRPTEGEFEEKYSLAPIAKWLSTALSQDVTLCQDWATSDSVVVQPGDVVLLENVRFAVGEKSNDEQLSKKLASFCDVYVMDAFGTAHRAHASTHGVIRYAPVSCAGPLLSTELEALGQAIKAPERPLVSIVGGSKVSTKLGVLESLVDKVDYLIVGGGIANTFLAAAGFSVGKSLFEPDLVETAKRISEQVSVPLPTDVVVAKTFSETAPATVKAVTDVAEDDMILDIGPETTKAFSKILLEAKTILWNGPVGVFEMGSFRAGTEGLSHAIADSDAFSVAGGGDTLAAIDLFGLADKVSYISTGGGAFLELVEGKTLPAVEALERAST